MALSPRPAPTADATSEADQREERKCPVPMARARLIEAWLDARLPRDPRFPEGVITSCYYDSISLDAYQESVDGELLKQKLRLRWYGEPIDRYAGVWLELKSRDGARSFKHRVRAPIEGNESSLGLVIPDQQTLRRQLRELETLVGQRFAPTLQPTAIVRYRRIRWQTTDGSLRASLDTDVRVAAPQGLPIWLPLPDGGVLELKSAGELPPQAAHLGRLGLRRSAHSKYALAVERLYGGERARVG